MEGSQTVSGQGSVPHRLWFLLGFSDPKTEQTVSCRNCALPTPVSMQATARLTGLAGVAGVLAFGKVALYLKQRMKTERHIES